MFLDLADPEIQTFLWSLYRQEVRYMLIGGAAVNMYGAQRATQDMDIWLAPTNENRDLFVQTLVEIGYTIEELDDLTELDFTKTAVFSAWIGKESLDCMNYAHHAFDFEQAYSNHQVIYTEGGAPIRVVPLDYLRELKVRAKRWQDWQDVLKLDEIHGPIPPVPVPNQADPSPGTPFSPDELTNP